MLQPSTTTPGLSNTTGCAGTPAYSGSSKRFAGENEYTWWRTLSLLGNVTAVPTSTATTSGTNSLSTWSTTPPRGCSGRWTMPSAGIATTTASATGRPRASTTLAVMPAVCACASAGASTNSEASSVLRMMDVSSVTIEPRDAHRVADVGVSLRNARAYGGNRQVDRSAVAERIAQRHVGIARRATQPVDIPLVAECRVLGGGRCGAEQRRPFRRCRRNVAAAQTGIGGQREGVAERDAGAGIHAAPAQVVDIVGNARVT